jgi:hypothetical protein
MEAKMSRVLLFLILLATGCGFPNAPTGGVVITIVGTTLNGDAIVGFKQTWQRAPADSGGIYNKYLTLLVHPDGQTEPTAYDTALLAQDCADNPSNLGACIPFTKTGTGNSTTWSFPLPDGGEIRIMKDATGTISRVTSDLSNVWVHDSVARPADAIRGNSLLVIRSDLVTVSKLNIENGETIWSITAPSELE